VNSYLSSIYSEVKTYSHGKAVRASFSVAWKNAREKAPYTAGKSLVKPAAMNTARIMRNDSAAQGCATMQHCRQLGRSPPPLKPKKVTFFTMILNNSENSIRDIRPCCHPLFCHSSVVKYT